MMAGKCSCCWPLDEGIAEGATVHLLIHKRIFHHAPGVLLWKTRICQTVKYAK